MYIRLLGTRIGLGLLSLYSAGQLRLSRAVCERKGSHWEIDRLY